MNQEQNLIPYKPTDLTGNRVLAFAPHPDDETLACGGSIILHIHAEDPVRLVFVTNGAKGGSQIEDDEQYCRSRADEARCACNILGVNDFYFWDFEDRNLDVDDELIGKIAKEIDQYQPSLIYLPSPLEFHPDHRAVAFAVERAIQSGQYRKVTLALYEFNQPLMVNALVDISDVLERKQQAIQCYGSQLVERDYGALSISLNRFRSFTLSQAITHAEGLFLCKCDAVRDNGLIPQLFNNIEDYMPYGSCTGIFSAQTIKPTDKARGSTKNDDLESSMIWFEKGNPPLVSVIIPTYNRPSMLRQAIGSVVSQTYPNVQIVVVNDGGLDVEEIIQDVGKDVILTYIEHSESKGVAAARNTGLRAAKGMYIAYLDDDDVFYSDHLEVLVNAIESQSADVVYSNSHEIVQQLINGAYITIGKSVQFDRDFDSDELLVGNYIPTLNVLHRKAVLDRCGFFDESLGVHEDWDLWIRFSVYYDFIHIKKVTAAYTTRKTDSSKRMIEKDAFYQTAKQIHSRYAHLVKDPVVLERQKKAEDILKYQSRASKIIQNKRQCARKHIFKSIHPLISDKDILILTSEIDPDVETIVSASKTSEILHYNTRNDSGDARKHESRYDHPLDPSNDLESDKKFGVLLCLNPEAPLTDILENYKGYLLDNGHFIVIYIVEDGLINAPFDGNKPLDSYIRNIRSGLTAYFPDIKLWGQSFNPSTVILPLNDDTMVSGINWFADMSLRQDDISLQQHLEDQMIAIIGVASDRDETIGLDKPFMIFPDIPLYQDQYELTHDLEEKLKEKENNLAKIVKDKDDHIDNLKSLLSERSRFSDTAIAEKNHHIENLEHIHQELRKYFETSIQSKDKHIENIEETLRERSKYFSKAIEDKENHIENLEATVKYQESQFKAELDEKDQQTHDIELAFQKRLQEQDERIDHIQSINSEQRNHISNLETNLAHVQEELSRSIKESATKDAQIKDIQSELSIIKSSRVWRLAEFLRRVVYNGLLKPFPSIRKGMLTLSREGARTTIAKARAYFRKNPHVVSLGVIESDYDRWIERCETPRKDSASAVAEIEAFSYSPTISIIMPVYNVDPNWLEKAIESVRNQWYPHWELCIADDASPSEAIRKVLARFEGVDNRIKVVYLKTNHGISDASNKALALATGDFVGLLDHDDELSEDALYRCVKVLNQYPDANLIYSDEDKLEINGKRVEPFFKPDFSPDLMLSINYICHFSLIRRGVIRAIGGFRRGFEGSQDYDLLLRVIEKVDPATIHHIPWILYHWRKIPGSAASVVDAKNYAFDAAKRALREYLERNGEVGDIQDGLFLGSYRVNRRIDPSETVSIIIPFRDQVDLLKTCVDSILQKTSYPKFEILLVDNQSRDDLTRQYLDQLSQLENIKILRYDYPFNYSAINNFAVKAAAGRFLLLLNNDMEVIVEEWLSAMVEHIQREEVGVVGAKLIFPNNLIQHAGVVIGIGEASHAFSHLPESDNGYFGLASVIRNCSAVTGACLMTRKDVYELIGGLDETNLTIAYNDVDYCLKAIEAGYRVVYTPYARLYHHESASRGDDNDEMLKIRDPQKYQRVLAERAYMREKWKAYIENDPYYNPHLTRRRNDFAIGV